MDEKRFARDAHPWTSLTESAAHRLTWHLALTDAG